MKAQKRGNLSSIQYQRPGERQKLRKMLVDLRIWPNPREGLVKKLGGMISAFLHRLFPRDIEPMAGAGTVNIIDHLVRVLRKARLLAERGCEAA